MTFIRKTVALLSLCALAGCADGRDNCKPGSSGTMLDLLLLAASLTCAAVVAASHDLEEDTANTAQAPAKPAAAANPWSRPRRNRQTPALNTSWLCNLPIPMSAATGFAVPPRRNTSCRPARSISWGI